MNRVKLKKEIISILKTENLTELFERIEGFENKKIINPLFNCLCHTDELVRWHAISVFGKTVSAIAENDIEDGRIIMRRFLWMLNDESGGIGWGVPEAMAEVMLSHDVLAKEYIHMLVSYTLDDGPELYQDGNFIELPLLQQGVLWGVCRMAEKYGEMLIEKKISYNLETYFLSDDAIVRGLVCHLVGLLNLTKFKKHASQLCFSDERIRLYENGTFYDCSVGEIASRFVQSSPAGIS